MSETRWTPGPWEFSHGNWQLIDGQNHYRVAEISSINEEKPEHIANAYLIAAAPQLYEALACFMEDSRFQVAVGSNPILTEDLFVRAKAALAAARGEKLG